MATEGYTTNTPTPMIQPQEQVIEPVVEVRKAYPVLTVETQSGVANVELKLTRGAIVDAERKGIIDMRSAERAPISFFYALTFAAISGKIKNAKVEDSDRALDRWFDEKDEYGNPVHSFQELSTCLLEQYQDFFGIGEVTGIQQD